LITPYIHLRREGECGSSAEQIKEWRMLYINYYWPRFSNNV